MRRREFIGRALAGVAAGSVIELLPACSRQQQSLERRGSTGAKSKIGYIRQEIPAFEIASYQGQRYGDVVPDTLDIADRATLAINGLTRLTDPALDFDIYFDAIFYQNPAILQHQPSDPFNQPKFQEALPLMRIITGSALNIEVDHVWTAGMLKSIGPDGLSYMAMEGRPWLREGLMSWKWNALLPDGRIVRGDEAPLGQITTQINSGRIMGVMTLHYLRDKNPIWRSTVERMIDRWAALAIDRGEYSYYPVAFLVPNAKPARVKIEPPTGGGAAEAEYRLIQGLAQYYRVSGYEPARILAGKLSNYVRYQMAWYDREGRFIDKAFSGGHFHSHTFGLLGMLECALAARDGEMAEFVKSSYEWAKTDAYGCALTGWYPETVAQNEEEIQAAVQRAKITGKITGIQGYRVCESCCIADMIAIALKLTEAGVGDYWDDVDRWVRNQFAVAQLTETDWVYRVGRTLPPTPVGDNETADQVAERSLGAFSGYTTGNDYGIEFGGDPDTGANPCGVAGCCEGNGTRAIYYVWQRIVDCHEGQLRVNLLLNRASAWVDVHSYIPYEGRVDLKIKQPCQSVLVRVPEWIESRSRQVIYTVNGTREPFAWEGRYVKAGSTKPGDTLTVTFPISERTLRNVRVGGADYTLVLKGNTVVSVDPPGKHYQLYQRDQYRRGQMPWRKVERFVSEEQIVW